MMSILYLKARALSLRAYHWLTTIHSATQSSVICP